MYLLLLLNVHPNNNSNLPASVQYKKKEIITYVGLKKDIVWKKAMYILIAVK